MTNTQCINMKWFLSIRDLIIYRYTCVCVFKKKKKKKKVAYTFYLKKLPINYL